MKKSQNSEFSMELAVQKTCNDNRPLWAGFTAFESAFGDFECTILKTNEIIGKQGINITGIAEDKQAIKESLSQIVLEVAGAVHAYACETGNFTLKEKVAIKSSVLDRLRATEFAATCLVIYQAADDINDQLSDYGVTDELMQLFHDKLDAFNKKLSAPRTAISERKGATDQLAKLLKKSNSILKDKLDKLMRKFEVSNPEFYNLYFDARIIVHTGRRHHPPPDNDSINPSV